MKNKQYAESKLATVYNPKVAEDHWYQFWIDNNLFQAKNNEEK